MSSDQIRKEALRLVKYHGTRNPFEIAKELGIHVLFDYDFETLKGMYKVIQRSRFIFINGNLDERDQRTICAHELGHDRLHREYAKNEMFQEFMLYNMQTRPEYEANIFASELLIDNDEIFSLIEDEYDIYQIARALDEDINLVLIKVDELRKQGHDVKAPYRPRSDFLGMT